MKNIAIKKIKSSEAPLELLLLADPSFEAVKKYLKKGNCVAALEGGEVVGVYVLISKSVDTLEIINLSVVEEKQNRGIGKLLVADAIKRAKKAGVTKLIVGTGNSSINQLAFYQKCGFRMAKIKKDYFIKKYKSLIYENGIQCRDMIILEIAL
ncbi:MAG: GNAT family N-acetyltransferase [Candidatus Moraniibacteriota bacterium]